MKKLCFLLCLLLTLISVVACGGNKDDPTETTKNDRPETTTDSQKKEEGIDLSVSDEITIGVGDTVQITAYDKATERTITNVIWKSDDTSVATVDFEGKVKGIADGTAKITATSPDESMSVSCTIHVTSVLSGISLTPEELTLTRGEKAEITVSFIPSSIVATDLTWHVGDPSIVSVDDGEVTALADGSTTIIVTAKDPNDPSKECTAFCLVNVVTHVTSIELSENRLSLEKGEEVDLVATITPTNATDKTVYWESSDPNVARVDSRGRVTARSSGRATITATSSNGLTDTCEVQVTVPVTDVAIDPVEVELAPGETFELTLTITPSNASVLDVVWESSERTIAAVDSDGVVTAIKPGIAVIEVSTLDGYYTATCLVTVTNPVTQITFESTAGDLMIGQTLTLLPIIEPIDADETLLTWTSSNPAVATVDENGMITALTPGTTTITVAADETVTASYELTVLDPATMQIPITAIQVSNTQVKAGDTFSLNIVLTPSNATEEYVIKSGNTSCVIVNSDGTLTALRKGTVRITVSAKDSSVSKTCYVTVSDISVEDREEMQREYDAAKDNLDRAHGEAIIAIDNQYSADIEFLTNAINNSGVTSEEDYNSQKRAIESQMATASDSDKQILQQELDSLEADWATYQEMKQNLDSLKSEKESAVNSENADYQAKLDALKAQYSFLFD